MEPYLYFAGSVIVPIIVAYGSFYIARKQITNAGVTQFRQQWIDGLRQSISIYIAKAEVIACLDLRDDKNYLDNFKELSQVQSKVELMLNPNEEDHNRIVEGMKVIRGLIHDEKLSERSFSKKADAAIEDLLSVTKVVLKREWNRVKKGK